jgi:hypothetical protein
MGGLLSDQLPHYHPQRQSSAGAHGPVPGRADPQPPSPDSAGQPPPGGLNPTPAEATEQSDANAEALGLPRLQHRNKGRRLVQKPDVPPTPLTAEQRLLLLDTWQRSKLPAGDFAPLVGLSNESCSQYPSCYSF